MTDLIETIVFAILLFVVAGAILFSQLWWVGLIVGGFALLLSVGIAGHVFGGGF